VQGLKGKREIARGEKEKKGGLKNRREENLSTNYNNGLMKFSKGGERGGIAQESRKGKQPSSHKRLS